MRKAPYNYRWVAGLLSMIIVIAAAGSGFASRCMDGTPCAMAHPSAAAQPSIVISGNSTVCTHCRIVIDSAQTHFAPMRCVLGVSSFPVTVVEKQHVSPIASVAVLPPPDGIPSGQATVAIYRIPIRAAGIASTYQLLHFGRAPPTLL
jgi:hypothetical protein